ncbi:MAG: dipeptidase [Bacteroidales bacterium]|jgi:acetylornithine deacetylase/succinyl-diaminopimelate desuccinylase-like protein
MDFIQNYIEQNKDRFLEELFDLIRIPSISSQQKHKPDMYKTAEFWKKAILDAGGDKAEVFETPGNPITYGEKIIDPKLPTVLVYGHMDVMPVDPIELWNTDPFEPVIKDGKIYARGADDDKGQSYMQAKAFELLVKTDKLPCNVKFLIEGEEEIGSTNLYQFCKDHKKMLEADVFLVSDTSMIAQDTPSITTGLRGLAYWEIEVTGPNKDLHSGIFGGAVANPVNVLCKLLADLTDKYNRITIPGFYDDVLIVSKKERNMMAKAPFDKEKYKEELGVKELLGEEGYTTNEHTWIRPSLDVCGIYGGYTEEGSKTIIPSKATAKLSCRLVPNQDHTKISKLVTNYFKKVAPKYVDVKVTPMHGGQAYVCPIDLPAYKAAERAFKKVYGKDPIPVRSGGSIPIISGFEQILGVKSILMGFGLSSDAIHSPNENYPLYNFYKGIETIANFYLEFSKEFKQLS